MMSIAHQASSIKEGAPDASRAYPPASLAEVLMDALASLTVQYLTSEVTHGHT